MSKVSKALSQDMNNAPIGLKGGHKKVSSIVTPMENKIVGRNPDHIPEKLSDDAQSRLTNKGKPDKEVLCCEE